MTEFLFARPSDTAETAQARLDRMTETKETVPHIDMPRAILKALMNGAELVIGGSKYRLLSPGDEIMGREGMALATSFQLVTELAIYSIGTGSSDKPDRTFWVDAHQTIQDLLNTVALVDGPEREALFKESFLANAVAAMKRDARDNQKKREERLRQRIIDQKINTLQGLIDNLESIELAIYPARDGDFELHLAAFADIATNAMTAAPDKDLATLVAGVPALAIAAFNTTPDQKAAAAESFATDNLAIREEIRTAMRNLHQTRRQAA